MGPERIIYFVTVCVKDRRLVLTNRILPEAIGDVTAGLRSWTLIAGVIMPERVHCFVCPGTDRDLSVGDLSNAFKRLLRQRIGDQEWEWQRGCFDRLLRSGENFSDKWVYMRENPVCARLVQSWEEWPYFFGLIEEQRRGS